MDHGTGNIHWWTDITNNNRPTCRGCHNRGRRTSHNHSFSWLCRVSLDRRAVCSSRVGHPDSENYEFCSRSRAHHTAESSAGQTVRCLLFRLSYDLTPPALQDYPTHNILRSLAYRLLVRRSCVILRPSRSCCVFLIHPSQIRAPVVLFVRWSHEVSFVVFSTFKPNNVFPACFSSCVCFRRSSSCGADLDFISRGRGR